VGQINTVDPSLAILLLVVSITVQKH
jgi:hypothetical protein